MIQAEAPPLGVSSDAPKRPASVPYTAAWVSDQNRWVEAEHAGRDGAPGEGRVRFYRPEGSLEMECLYQDGVPEGPFTRFHPDGAVAREGRFHGGVPDGVVVAHASPQPGGEPLRSCCVPPGAARLVATWSGGTLRSEEFLNQAHEPLLSSGEVRPARPPGVPGEARFDEGDRRWKSGTWNRRLEKPEGVHRSWDEGGALREETTFGPSVEDVPQHLQRVRWDERGQECLRQTFVRRGYEDIPDGPAVTPWVSGRFEAGQRVGWWTRVGGAEVARVSLGRPYVDGAGGEDDVFVNAALPADVWRARASALRAQDRVREAWMAQARAAARAQNATAWQGFVTAPSVPWTLAEPGTPAAQTEIDTVWQNASVSLTLAALLDAWVAGIPGATVLPVVAAQLSAAPLAALDLWNGLCLAQPGRLDWVAARAALHLELGDPRAARKDAEALADGQADAALFVQWCADLLFRPPPFPPASVVLPDDAGELEDLAPAQPSPAVAWALSLYATRAGELLRRLRAAAPGASWVDELPVAGPAADAMGYPRVPLRHEEAVIQEELTDAQVTGDITRVQVDERVPAGGSIPDLLRLYRANAAAWAWLCWIQGHDHIPATRAQALAAGEAGRRFGAALMTALARAFRAHDSQTTHGLRSRMQGVPDFSWQGLPVDELPARFLPFVIEEWCEVRALFLWLSNPGNLSPFQDDLRSL